MLVSSLCFYRELCNKMTCVCICSYVNGIDLSSDILRYKAEPELDSLWLQLMLFEVCFMCERWNASGRVSACGHCAAPADRRWRQDACTRPVGQANSCTALNISLSLSHAAFIFIIHTAPTTYCSCKTSFLCTHTHTHTPHTVTHTQHTRHTHTHTRTHARTHAHTHTCWFLWFTGTLHRRNGFLYCTSCMCYCPTPTLHLNLALTGDGAFLFSPQKRTLYDL